MSHRVGTNIDLSYACVVDPIFVPDSSSSSSSSSISLSNAFISSSLPSVLSLVVLPTKEVPIVDASVVPA